MTVEKLNLPAKENAVQQKINEVIDNLGGVTVDSALSTSSTNPVQNKVITSALATKTTVTFVDWSV